MKVYLEDVFKKSGIPTYTFVKPPEFNRILISLRTKGRGLIIEGPSGIGKTTCIQKGIEELELNKNVFKLSARKKGDVEFIESIASWKNIGTVVIDDFHVLSEALKAELADYMKVLADEENQTDKLILIGINKAGDSLVKLAADLNNRLDTIRFESTPDEKIQELIELGEKALNIDINTKDRIIELSKGSFHITQYLCNEICTYDGTLEKSEQIKKIVVSIEVIKEKVMEDFARNFYGKARAFAIGSKLRPEGRAPYLHLLYWLSQSEDWAIQIDDIVSTHPQHKVSIDQVVAKNFLENLIKNNIDIQSVIHYDSNSKILTTEDPKFMFYIRNILWNKFSKKIGFAGIKFSKNYDFALSFAGENRPLAEKISDYLAENEIAVFYDKNEQHRIIAENVEDYLAPIYSSEAQFVVPLISNHYPKKIWTKFESENFKDRFGDNSVIPILFSDFTPSFFDELSKYGNLQFNPSHDIDNEVRSICDILIKRIKQERLDENKKGITE